MPGLASAAGAALDAKIDPLMLGCVCGDDTVVIIMRTESAAQNLYLRSNRSANRHFIIKCTEI
jgi:arginine repressor